MGAPSATVISAAANRLFGDWFFRSRSTARRPAFSSVSSSVSSSAMRLRAAVRSAFSALVSEGQPTVDPKLASLGVDGLLTHIETVRDLRDAATLLKEVDVAARFRRVSHGFPCCL